ncbi:MAG: HD domain-containing protein [Thermoanaerobaculia bacterium]
MTSDTPVLGDRFAAAFSLAFSLHRGQDRKRAKDEQDGPGIPYTAHLMSVAALVLEHGGDEDEAIAGLLHDGPEDQGGQETLDDIRRLFGHRVADIVEACSDTFETPKPKWRSRKERYLDHLRKTTSPSVFLVSVADKVHNLRSILGDYRRIGDRLWQRFSGKRDGTLWYYAELLMIYQEKAPAKCADLVAEMERIYRELLDAIPPRHSTNHRDAGPRGRVR